VKLVELYSIWVLTLGLSQPEWWQGTELPPLFANEEHPNEIISEKNKELSTKLR
jgi:hypothetical protein